MGNTPVHKHIDGKLFLTFHVLQIGALARKAPRFIFGI